MKILKSLLPLFFISFSFSGMAQDSTATSNVAVSKPGVVQWMTFEEALKANEKEPRMWFVDMYTDWCGWCKKMDKETFTDSLIVDYLNTHYYPVKFNAEQKEDVLVKGRTFTYKANAGRRGAHELAIELMDGRMSYPTYVFLTSELAVFTKAPGYQPAKDMLPILEFCNSYDPANPTDWNTYRENYDSPYEE